MGSFQRWKYFCYWIRNRWSCWHLLVGSGGTRAQADLWRSSYASSGVELVIRSECLILCTCAGHCRIVSVLKVVSTFLFIMVAECEYGEECPAAVHTFLLPSPARRAVVKAAGNSCRKMQDREGRNGKARALPPRYSESNHCFPAAGKLWQLVVVRVMFLDTHHTWRTRRKALDALLAQ